MTIEGETSPSRPLERGASLTNIAQAGVLLAGFRRPAGARSCGRSSAMAASRSPCSPSLPSWRWQRASRRGPSCASTAHGPTRPATLPSSTALPPSWHAAPACRRAPRVYVVPSMLLSAFSIGSSPSLCHRGHRGPAATADDARGRRRAGARGRARATRRSSGARHRRLDLPFRAGALLHRLGAGGAQHPARH